MAEPMTSTTQSYDSAQLYVWVKGLESKVNTLLREVNLLKNENIRKNTDFNKELKSIRSDVLELKHEREQTQQKMDLIIKELRRTAGAEELATLKKYLDFWNPLHFVTQRDLERTIDARLAQLQSS